MGLSGGKKARPKQPWLTRPKQPWLKPKQLWPGPDLIISGIIKGRELVAFQGEATCEHGIREDSPNDRDSDTVAEHGTNLMGRNARLLPGNLRLCESLDARGIDRVVSQIWCSPARAHSLWP